MRRTASIISLALVLLAACGNNNEGKDKTVVENSQAPEKANTPVASSTPSGDGITGTWRMHLDAFDHNSNQVLDEDERKKAVPNNYRLQLNPDGTCRIQDVFTGTYKVKGEGGNKILEVQRKKVEGEETVDPIPDIYYIKSLTPSEMILLTTEAGSTVTFWIFKREK